MKKILSFCLMMLLAIQVAFAEGKTTPSTSDAGNLSVETGGGNNKATDETQTRDGGSNDGDKKIITSQKYVDDELAKKQNKIGTQSGTYAVTYTNTAGTVTPRQVKTALGSGTSDSALPTVSAVNAGLDLKQTKVPAKDVNTVVTYTGTEGVIGEKAIYQDDATYAGQMDNLIEAGAFNAAVKTGLDSEFLCAGNSSGGDCWLWSIHNEERENSNLFTTTGATLDKFYNASGVESSYTGLAHTDYIEVQPNTTYTYSLNCKLTGTNRRIIAWGASKNFISQMGYFTCSNNTQMSSTFTTTAATKYLTLNYAYNPAGENPQLEVGSSASAYQAPAPFTNLVPDGYTPVEYIKNNASTYVNTGVTPSVDNVEVNIRFYNNTTSSNYIFQSRASSSGTLYGITGSSTGATINATWNNGSARSDITRTVGHIYTINAKFIDGVVTLYVRDETTGQESTNIGTYTFDVPASPLGIFGNAGGNRIDSGQRVFSAWIKVGGQYVMNYIPVIYNGTAGFYDTVSQSFKGATSGSLVGGSEINNIVYIPQGD